MHSGRQGSRHRCDDRPDYAVPNRRRERARNPVAEPHPESRAGRATPIRPVRDLFRGGFSEVSVHPTNETYTEHRLEVVLDF